MAIQKSTAISPPFDGDLRSDILEVPVFISRPALAARWCCTSETLKRKERVGLLKPVVIGPRLLRYKMSEIVALENSATLDRRQEEVRA